jgi:hypothetical protein
VIASLIGFFGLVGLLEEVSAGDAEKAGIVLAAFFIFVSLLLFAKVFIPKRKRRRVKPVKETEVSEDDGDIDKHSVEIRKKRDDDSDSIDESVKENEGGSGNNVSSDNKEFSDNRISSADTCSLCSVIKVVSILEIVFFAMVALISMVFGAAGLKAGEMGTMLGIILYVAVFFFAGVLALRITVLLMVKKRKLSAGVINLVLAALYSVSSFSSGSGVIWALLVYSLFLTGISVFYIRDVRKGTADINNK